MGPSRPGGLPAPSRAPPKGGRGHAWWPSPGHLVSREQGRGGGAASPAPGPPSVPKAGGGPVGAKSGRRGQTQRGAGWGHAIALRRGAARHPRSPRPVAGGRTGKRDLACTVRAAGHPCALGRQEIAAQATAPVSAEDAEDGTLRATSRSRKDKPGTARSAEEASGTVGPATDPGGPGQEAAAFRRPDSGALPAQVFLSKGPPKFQSAELEVTAVC